MTRSGAGLYTEAAVGTFSVKISIEHPFNPQRSTIVECLVDSGAAYTQLPASLLRSLEIQPFEERQVVFADGREGTRPVGGVVLRVEGRKASTTVLFGDEQGLNLLGANTLQELGLGIDPVRHRLIPIRLPMAGAR